MTFVVPIALFGWIPVAFLLFLLLPQRRAILATYLLGWLFLPQAALVMPGVLPDFDRYTACAAGSLAAVLVFDFARLASFKPTRWDLPILVWCLCPVVSSLVNGLGVYSGLGAAMVQTIRWGIPFLLGRLYLSDRPGLVDLAGAIVIGGLLYVPLCLYEIRMSPQLHTMFYGYHQHSFAQSKRFGGWRPTVFLEHGLAVGMWVSYACLMWSWTWATGTIRRWEGATVFGGAALGLTALLCKSLGAIFLLAGGLGAVFSSRWARSSLPIVALALLPVAYMAARSTKAWSGKQLRTFMVENVSQDRGNSLETRHRNEDVLSEKAWQRPVFGWGGFGRHHVLDDHGKKTTVTDGLWILTFGKTGLVGLVSMSLVLVLPQLLVALRLPRAEWRGDALAITLGISTLIGVFFVDSLFNAQYNPFVTLGAGGLTGLLGVYKPWLATEGGPDETSARSAGATV
jgi:hypothetical protein